MTRTHADKDSLASILAYINTYLKYNGKQGLLDENKALEDVMCEVLNRIYGWKLENLNHVEKNFPGIDLFYPQLGVKFCSMAGGGVQKSIWCF